MDSRARDVLLFGAIENGSASSKYLALFSKLSLRSRIYDINCNDDDPWFVSVKLPVPPMMTDHYLSHTPCQIYRDMKAALVMMMVVMTTQTM